MSKILLIGCGPLVKDSTKYTCSYALRTFHILKALRETGHNVRLMAINIDPSQSNADIKQIRSWDDFQYILLSGSDEILLSELQHVYLEGQPDCIIGANTIGASLACQLKTGVPIWADLFGWVIAEGQCKAYLENNDAPLYHFFRQEHYALKRADKFSTVSKPQMYATIGELALYGRLNKYTQGYNFVHQVPCGIIPERFDKPAKLLRGKVVPADAFVLLWTGSFNVWTDIDFLFEALERLFSLNSRIHFVCTGGPVFGHAEYLYHAFCERVKKSKFSTNYHLLGWVDYSLMKAYCCESDLGINIDSPSTEVMFGGRTRIVHMMNRGLPVITTLGTDISYELKNNEVGITIPLGDRDGFVSRILYYAEAEEELKSLSGKVQEYAQRNFSYKVTTKPILDWVLQPDFAPDNKHKFTAGIIDPVANPLNPLERVSNLLAAVDQYDQLLKDSADLKNIRAKKVYKLAKFLKHKFFP